VGIRIRSSEGFQRLTDGGGEFGEQTRDRDARAGRVKGQDCLDVALFQRRGLGEPRVARVLCGGVGEVSSSWLALETLSDPLPMLASPVQLES
jgi:hypothetical protein